MSKRQKEPKPYTNRFQLTKSQKHKYDESITNLPKSKYYRQMLEPLLGAVVTVECETWAIVSDTVDGVRCDKILLIGASVVKCPKNRNVELPIQIPHIWTVIDADWKNRNRFPNFCNLQLKGFLYLYNHKGEKNIGLQTLSARPVQGKIPEWYTANDFNWFPLRSEE